MCNYYYRTKKNTLNLKKKLLVSFYRCQSGATLGFESAYVRWDVNHYRFHKNLTNVLYYGFYDHGSDGRT